MKGSVFTVLALLASSVAAARKCGNTEVPADLRSEAAHFKTLTTLTGGPNDPATRTLKVKLYLHNVYISRDAAGGYISRGDIEKQYRQLNRDYASTGVYFDLRRIIHTKNPVWAQVGREDPVELEMKKALRRGDYGDLNIYLRPIPAEQELLGYCTFPTDVEPNSDAFWLDGCDVLGTTIPGGSEVPYDQGKTASHEAGHWFGLFHTFQDGCDGGDFVSDTPAQDSPTFGCPGTRDSCTGPAYPGLDPIHNYMDYSDE
ncbi:Ulilysin [Dactylellina cionopaga]|nr:Ulilysin [Dactylellina cionopaga]